VQQIADWLQKLDLGQWGKWLLSTFENVSVFLKAPQVRLEQAKCSFGIPRIHPGSPQADYAAFLFLYDAPPLRRQAPRRGEDRFRNPLVELRASNETGAGSISAAPARHVRCTLALVAKNLMKVSSSAGRGGKTKRRLHGLDAPKLVDALGENAFTFCLGQAAVNAETHHHQLVR
jgi:hypothetical protein